MSTQRSYFQGSHGLFHIEGRVHLPTLQSLVRVTLNVLTVTLVLAVIYFLTIPQLLIAAVAGTLLMALTQRIAKLQLLSENHFTQHLDSADGGAFSVKAFELTKKQISPVVFDGGSFERSITTKFK